MIWYIGERLLKGLGAVVFVGGALFVLVMISQPQPTKPPPDTVIGQKDDGAVVALDEGAWLIIRLPGKESGRWDEISRDGGGAVCRMCRNPNFGDDFVPSNAADGTGMYEIRYRGWVSYDGKGISKEKGEKEPVKITLGYRPSKDAQPTATFTFTATVYTKKR